MVLKRDKKIKADRLADERRWLAADKALQAARNRSFPRYSTSLNQAALLQLDWHNRVIEMAEAQFWKDVAPAEAAYDQAVDQIELWKDVRREAKAR